MWLWVAAVWTVLGVLAASQHLAFMAYSGRSFPVGTVVGRTMLDWYTCGVFTPFIFWVAERFRLDGRRWPLMLPIHVGACVLFIVLKLALFLPIANSLGWIGEKIVFVQWLYGDAFALTLAYAGVVGARYALDYYTTSARLESRLARVQLDALRSQLHPHFLFNALNALSTLIHRDTPAADRMIIELSELLRHTLAEDSPPEVTLREELEFVRRYLAIMQIRFGDRLQVQYDVETEALAAYVPNMVLQPLVENALVHGIGRATGAGRVVIRARRDRDALELAVADDGPGLTGAEPVERIGLRNTRALLEQLYRREQSLAIRNQDGTGVVVTVLLPFHTSI